MVAYSRRRKRALPVLYNAVPNPYAKRVLRYAWANRGKVSRASRTIQRAYRSYKGRKRLARRMVKAPRVKSLGTQDPAPQASPGALGQDNNKALNMGTLGWRSLPYPAWSSTNTINTRQGLTIWMSGVKICRQFYVPYNATEELLQPVEVHWGLIQLKQSMEKSGIDASTLGSLIKQDFFRSRESNSRKAKDFVDYTGSGGAKPDWDMTFNCCPMNPDGAFKVLAHKRKVLTPSFSTAIARQPARRSYWKIEYYQKIGQRAVWDETATSGNDQYPENPIFEVFWYNTITPDNFPTEPAGALAQEWLRTQSYNILYWKDKFQK